MTRRALDFSSAPAQASRIPERKEQPVRIPDQRAQRAGEACFFGAFCRIGKRAETGARALPERDPSFGKRGIP